MVPCRCLHPLGSWSSSTIRLQTSCAPAPWPCSSPLSPLAATSLGQWCGPSRSALSYPPPLPGSAFSDLPHLILCLVAASLEQCSKQCRIPGLHSPFHINAPPPPPPLFFSDVPLPGHWKLPLCSRLKDPGQHFDPQKDPMGARLP